MLLSKLNIDTKSSAAVVLLLAVSVIARIWNIELRPLHHDEGVNFHFFEVLRNKSFYPYSHENFHGPLFFYLGAWLSSLFNDSILGLRMLSIVIGSIIPLGVFLLFRLSKAGLIAAALCAFSPSLLYYSRYAIHEIFFTVAATLLALSFWFWLLDKNKPALLVAAISFAFAVSLKETFVISCFCILLASVLLSPRVLLAGLLQFKSHLALAGLLALILICIIYTGGFQWTTGLRELALSVPQWIGRGTGDVGHVKPWHYYLWIIVKTEPWLFLALFAFPSISLLSNNSKTKKTVIFLGFYTLSLLIVYSLVPYKTPWLIINVTLPAIILLGLLISSLSQALCWTVTSTILLFTLGFGYYFNFKVPYGPKNPFSYVHSTVGTTELVDKVKIHCNENPECLVLIAVSSWPLPYYFRDLKTQIEYDKIKPGMTFEKYSFLVLPKGSKTPKNWHNREELRLSDYHEASLFFRK